MPTRAVSCHLVLELDFTLVFFFEEEDEMKRFKVPPSQPRVWCALR